MTGHPELVGGERRDVTRLMRAVPDLMAKGGAEGMYAAALPGGPAVAVKISDGAHRASGVVLAAALARGRCRRRPGAVRRPDPRPRQAGRHVPAADRERRVTSPTFRTLDDVHYGRVEQVSPLIRRVIAENPSKFTYRGTGTYILGHGDVVVIDPGPRLDSHRDALAAALAGERVRAILVTHCHSDHSPLAAWLRAETGAPTLRLRPAPAARSEVGGARQGRPGRLRRARERRASSRSRWRRRSTTTSRRRSRLPTETACPTRRG